MKIIQSWRLAILLTAGWATGAVAAPPSATEIVERVESLLWGKTAHAEFDMAITTPAWSRTMAMTVWMDRPTRSFARITAPAKEAGIRSLRIGSEMWNYMPNIERTIKIPPSMMLQPWLGTDFTNDDMVKESNVVSDYTHQLVAERNVDSTEVYEVESLPKPDAAVVWGKLVLVVRKSDLVPQKVSYFNERGELVRVLSYSEVKTMDGRAIPTRWEMQAVNKPGKHTTIVIKSIRYDRPIESDMFSLRNLAPKG
jgi:outer membrane lipoprotein-sorting protein